jgi:hypothetical protein
MVTFIANGTEYGINDTAIRFGGYPDIEQISRTRGAEGYVEIGDERQPVPVFDASLDALLERAQRFCA